MGQIYRAPRLQSIFSKGKLIHHARGQTVSTTDEDGKIMLVVKGYIKRYMISNDGTIGVQMLYGPEDLFLLTRVYQALLGQSLYDGPEVYYYETLCDTQLLYLSIDAFTEAANAEPLLYKELFSETGRRLKACVNSLENMSFGNIYKRVAHQLVFFAREYGEVVPEGIKIDVPLTHQDIADILETTRESVTRAMVMLRSKEILHSGRDMVVINIDKLTHEAFA